MIDNITFKKRITEQQYVELLQLINTLGDVFTYRFARSGTVGESVMYRSLKIGLTEKYLSVAGSLPNFLYSSNQFNVTHSEIKVALGKISELLNIDLSDAVINRIDVANNFVLQQRVETYLKLLISKDRTKRWPVADESLYFSSKNGIELNFYDKNREIVDKGGLVLKGNEQANILRYEMRIKAGLSKHLGLKKFTVADLVSDDIYYRLITLWYSEYASIIKLSYTAESNIGDTVPDFRRFLMMNGIQKIGATETFQLIKSHPPFSLAPRKRGEAQKLVKELINEMQVFNAQDALSELEYNVLAAFEDAS